VTVILTEGLWRCSSSNKKVISQRWQISQILYESKNCCHKLKLLSIISSIFLVACNDGKNSFSKELKDTTQINVNRIAVDTIPLAKNVWIDKLTKNKYNLPDTIGTKPVSFYLSNPKVAPIAKLLYQGKFRPEDNDSTALLLNLINTDDEEIRPFYLWCLDLTIQISDGALAEYPGGPALKYATKFPKEFFSYIDKDQTGQRYKEWTEIIAYSGLNDFSRKSSEIQNDIINKMINNCRLCDNNIKARITTFAKDITNSIKLQD
jgi:hypothetical protein